MKRIILLSLLCISFTFGNAQSYLGWVTTQVNLREGPGTNHGIIRSMPQGTQIFIVSNTTENGFVNIIEIASNKEGYVSKAFIKLGDEVEISQGGIFQSTGATSTYKPEIKIYNNTLKTLTLKLNDIIYTFASRERKSFHLDPGVYNYRASAPGVIPDLGMENLENNRGYEWEFYIISR